MEVVAGLAAGLAAKAVEIITPYLQKGFEKFAEDVGQATADKVKDLFSTIKARLSGDKVASENLARYEKKPEIYGPVIQDTLEERLKQDKNLTDELQKLLNEPAMLEITQKIDRLYGKLTGLEAEEMVGGKAKVTEIIGEAGKEAVVTGAKIKRIGGQLDRFPEEQKKAPETESLLGTLKTRLSRGEITLQQFEEIKKILESN